MCYLYFLQFNAIIFVMSIYDHKCLAMDDIYAHYIAGVKDR